MSRFGTKEAIAVGVAAAFAALVFAQSLFSGRNLQSRILRTGRIVLSSKSFPVGWQERAKLGRPSNVLDGDTDTGTVLSFPPQAKGESYLLVDVGLSHDPPALSPRPRRPEVLVVHAGPCTACAVSEFRRYGRPRNVRIELYGRQANNPDQDFRHEPPLLVQTWDAALADRPGPQMVSIRTNSPPPSTGYPHNVRYYSVKIVVLDSFPGTIFRDSVAFCEVLYGDTDAALQGQAPIRYWK